MRQVLPARWGSRARYHARFASPARIPIVGRVRGTLSRRRRLVAGRRGRSEPEVRRMVAP
jgi:hypothetical protein